MEKQTPIIELKNVSMTFDGFEAVKNCSLSIKRGEFVTLLGPSGCGKTTTLRMIAGFEIPTKGKILFDGKEITNLPPYKRRVNTVFQKYALFPHLNVFNNIAFGLKLRTVSAGTSTNRKGETIEKFRHFTKREIAQKVNDILKMVDLEDYGHRSVASLSGGQQQRVAIARALVNEPEVLLLDEPLGALDLKMRKDMQIELMEMHKKLGITFIYVTHDQEEALTMSDTIVVMRAGIIQQIATPEKVYDEPANAFVADFIGESNIFSGVMLQDLKVEFCEQVWECVDKGFKKNEPIDVIIRPEDIKILSDGSNRPVMATGKVDTCVFKGDHYQIVLIVNGNELMVHDTQPSAIGEEVNIYIKPFDLHIMHKARIINEIKTEMWDPNFVEICGKKIACNSDLPSGTKVIARIDFDDIEVMDDESEGAISATVVSSIYKGSYYQVILRTDDYYDFFVDTDDDWLKGDRVGINIAADKIEIEVIQEDANEAEKTAEQNAAQPAAIAPEEAQNAETVSEKSELEASDTVVINPAAVALKEDSSDGDTAPKGE